ncbi:serine/threonine protein kinase [Nitzschia inconspicua]|uniref:non-specific serine/threonine protein kinase n=1 Tax=Nitzschia inconspicua TaxID=303405 RepID=A0A9K3LM28_9STRA|nr:serine/threonine protein kinase [Nitzschia inconspicua]
MTSRLRQRSFSASSYETVSSIHRNEKQQNKSRVGDSSGNSDASPSIPSLQTALFGARGRSAGSSGDSSSSATAANRAEDVSASAASGQDVSPISNDQERQILLLLLLAQVCSLHDSTPRTYTVHVLQLFERGILDRESIQFLFELGLVPSIETETRGLLTEGTVNDFVEDISQEQAQQKECESLKIALTPVETSTTAELSVTTSTTAELARIQQVKRTHYSTETLRSMEAKAIRRQLSQHEVGQEKNQHGTSLRDNNGNEQSMEDPGKPWEVEHFPLSLSRYQREFQQISLLNRGGFGSVFHVVRKMDGCDYAMKLITFDSVGYSNENIQKVVREVQCLAKVSEHPNIVRYYTSWLEPSWMTGGSAGPTHGPQNKQLQQLQHDAMKNASPQQLLKDIENLLDTSYDIEELEDESQSVTPSASSSDSSCSFSSGEKKLFATSSRQRRYSWDCSTPSANDSSWRNDRSFDLTPRVAPLETTVPSLSGGPCMYRSQGTAKQTQSRQKQYKYQVTLYIQMQLCHPATLEDWIRERNRQVPENDHATRIGPALDIFHQLCSGLSHIHEKNIVHRDLKPANAFASKDGKVIKIGDFGLSKEIHDIANQDSMPSTHRSSKRNERFFPKGAENGDASPRHSLNTSSNIAFGLTNPPNNSLVEYDPHLKNDPMTIGIGTASYAAPEQIRSKHYGTPADIFSLGLILLELCCNFETQHEKLHTFQQCRNQKVPRWLENHYPDIASTILSCTRANPNERPTAKQLLNMSVTNSPRSNLEIEILKGQLLEKDRLLAEKDKMIEDLQIEMEKMRATLFLMSDTSPSEESSQIVVASKDATKFDHS